MQASTLLKYTLPCSRYRLLHDCLNNVLAVKQEAYPPF